MVQWLLIGTYTEPILFGTGEVLQGKGAGIYLYAFDEATGRFSGRECLAQTQNPSFLCVSEPLRAVYAVNELKAFEGEAAGAVSAFALKRDAAGKPALRLLNQLSTGGTDPCHVNVDAQGRCVFVANFMSGSVTVYKTAADGSLAARSQFIQHGAGSGADPGRQAGPHAHSVVLDPAGSRALVPDLGMDRLMVYDIDFGAGQLRATANSWSCKPGDGPRFCAFHPGGRFCYLINELGSAISLLHYDAPTGAFEHRQRVSTIPDNFDGGGNICADLHITPDGRHLYASNRGHNSLAAFAIDQKSGELTLIDRFSCGGKTPRNFTVSAGGGYLLVGNQDSDNLVSFRIDAATGRLEQWNEIEAPTPVCVRNLRI